MIKEYVINNEPLNIVLDKIDTFITQVNKFDDIHGNYKYYVSISKGRDLWDAKLKINNEKEYNTNVSKSITGTPSVL